MSAPATPTSNHAFSALTKTDEKGVHHLSLRVGGVHCALCIQKIESRLQTHHDVRHARLNFSTGRLAIVWDGDIENADIMVDDIQALGYSVHPFDPGGEENAESRENRFLLLCLGVAGFAMGNIMLLSVGLWATDQETMGLATRGLLHWVSALIAIPAIIYAGRPFFRSALSALKNGHTNMDVPISLALVLATGMSVFETIHHGEHVYFDSAVMLMFFLLIGRYLDFRARRHARSAATDLMQTLSGFATVVEGSRTRPVLIRDLAEGMLVQVAAGDKIPIDGVIENGTTMIDTALITGETLPRQAGIGDTVHAGTINQSTPIIIKVSKAAEDSLLADIVRLMEQAEQAQANRVRLADKAARLYTPLVHSLAALAFILWFFILGAQWQDALLIAVTVLIITCPCALGLAVPVVQVLATGRLMKQGVLVKSGDALERLAQADTIIFDKTGTLTLGRPALQPGYDSDFLQLAASLASHSSHPLSKAIAHAYQGDLLPIEEVIEHPGAGLKGLYNGQKVRLGSAKWCGIDTQGDSLTRIHLGLDGREVTHFDLDDELRTDAEKVLSALRGKGFHMMLLSGDRASVAETIGRKLGINTIHAEKTPVDKADIQAALRDQGHKVLMVGDGLNDAPALAAADVSMAPGTAVDMAQNTADIVFMGDHLSPVADTIAVARKTQSLVIGNFALAIAYNIIAIPLAFAGFVTPMIAALAMSGSSLLVIANSFRLKYRS